MRRHKVVGRGSFASVNSELVSWAGGFDVFRFFDRPLVSCDPFESLC